MFDSSKFKERAGSSIGVVKARVPSFRAATVGKALLGLVGEVAMEAAGEAIIVDNHIEDPAWRIARRELLALSSRHALVMKNPTLVKTAGGARRWDTDLVLQVSTTSWSMFAFRDAPLHYRVSYEARLELRDASGTEVLASGQCETPYPKNSQGAPTYDEMLADGARLLKQRLDAAVAFCAEKFARELFAISPTLEAPTAPAPSAPPAPADAPPVTRGAPRDPGDAGLSRRRPRPG